jgi:hypothetical protein
LGPKTAPMGLALTQEEAQQFIILVQDNSLTPTPSHNSATADVETGPKFIEH